MPGLLCLPDEVLTAILTHVPLKDRLGSCSLVHSRLHGAAVAATRQVEVGASYRRIEPERAQSALAWLSVHGQHVTRLEVSLWRDWSLMQTLTQLQSCPNLLDLRLHGGVALLGPTSDGQAGMFQGLTKLTRLMLNAIASDGAVDSLSSLVHLQHLSATAELSATTLPRLQHLTHLTNHRMSLENLRQLSVLTALLELDCRAADHIQASPNSVTGLALPPCLTQLALNTNSDSGVEAALLPLVPTGLRALSITVGPWDALDTVFTCIARLQCLTQLELFVCDVMDWPPPGPAYSALTASSSLVSLKVIDLEFPAGVWPFVFCASHQLPHLTFLAFRSELDEPEVPCWAFGAADLAALTRCCPGLVEIRRMALLPGPHVSELHKLTALTRLSVCGDDDPAGNIRGLAAVTQLKVLVLDLVIPAAASLATVASLLPLTSLTRLTCLRCTTEEYGHEHVVDTQAGSPPDVWLQLLEQCAAADPGCHPTALRGLAQQLAEQRALTAAQAQQIAGLQAQLSAQQQRHEAAQRQVAAEQGAHITALEGQLQQLLQRLL